MTQVPKTDFTDREFLEQFLQDDPEGQEIFRKELAQIYSDQFKDHQIEGMKVGGMIARALNSMSLLELIAWIEKIDAAAFNSER